MIYSVICKSKEELDAKLNKYVKLELLDKTYDLNINEKRNLIQCICEYIQVNYNFSYINDNNEDENNNIVILDTFKFCHLYYICDNANIIDNTIYFPLVDINKYNWFVEQFDKYNNIKDLTLNFKIEYDDKIISEYNKKRFGKYMISITDNK